MHPYISRSADFTLQYFLYSLSITLHHTSCKKNTQQNQFILYRKLSDLPSVYLRKKWKKVTVFWKKVRFWVKHLKVPVFNSDI